MPPTTVIGAATARVHDITTSICTCCTSLVMRVISDGAPNWSDLAGREVGDPVEQGAAHVAPEAHGDPGAVRRRRAIANTTWTSVDEQHGQPTDRM